MKNTGLAAFLNFVFPGVGYIYAGRRVGFGVMLFLSELLILAGVMLLGAFPEFRVLLTEPAVWLGNHGGAARVLFVIGWLLAGIAFAVDGWDAADEGNLRVARDGRVYEATEVD